MIKSTLLIIKDLLELGLEDQDWNKIQEVFDLVIEDLENPFDDYEDREESNWG